MVAETKTRTVKTCKMVPEKSTKTQRYCKMVAETREREVPYTVTRKVQEQKTINRVRYERKLVPYTVDCWIRKPITRTNSCDEK